MKQVGFGKGQGFTHEASQPLAQSVEPTLDMTGLSTVLAHRLRTKQSENVVVGFSVSLRRG
jgi:hypothetical protein